MPPPSLLTLPDDVFLETVEHLGIADVLSLLTTCSALRIHFSSRSMWITILNTARDSGPRPLPCPPKQDFNRLDLLDLQKIGLRALRIERNLEMEKPCPTSPIKSINLDPGDSLYTVIPGAHLVITYNRTAKKLCCWDILLGTCVSWLDNVGACSRSTASSSVEDGKCILAVFTHLQESECTLSAICVDYRDRNAISMRTIFEQEIPWDIFFATQFLIDDEIIGAVGSRGGFDETTDISGVVFNMATGKGYVFKTEILDGVTCSYLFNRHLYIFAERRNQRVMIHDLPPELLPYSNNLHLGEGDKPEPLIINTPNLYPDRENRSQGTPHVSSLAMNMMPSCGAHPVTSWVFKHSGTARKISVCIWPVEASPDDLSSLSFGPATGDLTFCTEVPGWHSIYAAGAYVVIYIAKQEGEGGTESGEISREHCLRLLHFVADPVLSLTVRDLDITIPAESIDVTNHFIVAMDDHLGLVFLVDPSRRLFTVSYG